MRNLNDELSLFTGTIVHGNGPSSQIDAAYPNYSVATAIEIYRNNYRGNLHDALVGAYPVIQQLVGDDFFRFLARKFAAQHPSHSGNLHYYGAEMANFVAAFEPAQELVYLPDIAVLEWACHCAYFADDAVTLDINRLGQVSPEHYPDLILRIHPACQAVQSNYPIAAIWQAHQPGSDSDFHIDLDSGPGIALVSRKENVVRVNELADADADWLQGIQAGIPLGIATAATLGRYPNFDLQAALLNMLAQDILTDFDYGTTPYP